MLYDLCNKTNISHVNHFSLCLEIDQLTGPTLFSLSLTIYFVTAWILCSCGLRLVAISELHIALDTFAFLVSGNLHDQLDKGDLSI